MAFEHIVNANYVDIYYGTVRKPDEYVSTETLSIKDYEEGTGSDLLISSQILLKSQRDTLGTLVERYKSLSPEFTIIKILKKENVSKIVFRKDDEELFEQVFYYYDEGIVQPNTGYKLPAVLRYEFNSTVEESPEYYIHKNLKSAHKGDVKSINYESNNNNLVSKLFIDEQYKGSKSDELNGNFITKILQIFYLGNLILDSQEMGLISDKSYVSDLFNINKDTNMNTIINIRNKLSDIGVGELR